MLHIKLIAICTLIWTSAAHADVKFFNEQGFISTHRFILKGDTAKVFAALTQDVDKWWNGDHSYSLDAANFYMDAKAGGCFCETLPNGGSVEHMRVVFVNPGKELRLSGGLGPLQSAGAQGVMVFKLSSMENATTALEYTYTVTGISKDGWNSMASAVDTVQGGQLKRLQEYLATH